MYTYNGGYTWCNRFTRPILKLCPGPEAGTILLLRLPAPTTLVRPMPRKLGAPPRHIARDELHHQNVHPFWDASYQSDMSVPSSYSKLQWRMEGKGGIQELEGFGRERDAVAVVRHLCQNKIVFFFFLHLLFSFLFHFFFFRAHLHAQRYLSFKCLLLFLLSTGSSVSSFSRHSIIQGNLFSQAMKKNVLLHRGGPIREMRSGGCLR